MNLPEHQQKALDDANLIAAPEHILVGAAKAALESGEVIAIYFDSGADEKYAADKGYGYGPLAAVELLFHPLLGRVLGTIHIISHENPAR